MTDEDAGWYSSPKRREEQWRRRGTAKANLPLEMSPDDRPVTIMPGRGSEEDAGEAPLSPLAASSEGAESSENGGTSFMYVRPNGLDLSARLPLYFFYSRARPRQT